jgi:hypothetical protein
MRMVNQVEPEHTHNSNVLHNLVAQLIVRQRVHLYHSTSLPVMNHFLRYALLATTTLLTGCVAVNIQSNVRPEAKPDFQRILIVSKLPVQRAGYLARFQTAFPPTYQVCSVVDSPLAFETSAELIQRQQEACKSEVALTLEFSRNYTSGGGKVIASFNEIRMEMSSLASGKAFWKAIVTTSGSNEIPPQKIVDQLIKDGVISRSTDTGQP